MVVTGVFTILSAIVLSANNRFGDQIILKSLAHDIALSIREAQVYGISVKRYTGGSGNPNAAFDISYGMQFTLPIGGEESRYALFADANSDGVFTNGDGSLDSVLTTTTIRGGFEIIDLCVRMFGSIAEDCTPERIDIVFRRPEPDACIGVAGGTTFDANLNCNSPYDKAIIKLQSVREGRANVVVEASGQIAVE